MLDDLTTFQGDCPQDELQQGGFAYAIGTNQTGAVTGRIVLPDTKSATVALAEREEIEAEADAEADAEFDEEDKR